MATAETKSWSEKNPAVQADSEIWVVIPAFNEGPVIDVVLTQLLAHYSNIVLVDDGSSDNTCQAACEHNIAVLRHPVNLGQGAALQTGITYALRQGAEYIVTFDADGQHDVADLETMISVLQRTKSDVALGSRFLGESVDLPSMRMLVLKAAIIFTWFGSGIRLTDTHNGFRALTRRAAQRIEIRQDRMAHASEIIRMIRAHRLRYVEVPVTITYSAYSLSKGQRISGLLNILGELFFGRIRK